MSDLVVYYTRTNTTKNVASIIKDELDADVLEVIDKKNRQGPIGYLRGGLDAIRSKKTSIEYEDVNFEKYDNIYIGTPVGHQSLHQLLWSSYLKITSLIKISYSLLQ